MKTPFLAALFSLIGLAGFGQVHVLDAETREAIPGAAVFSGSPAEVTGVTDAKGVLIGVAAYTNIRVEALGYFPFSGQVPQSGQLDVLLVPRTQELEAAVVTGQSAQTTVERAVHRMQVVDIKQARTIGALTVRDALELQSNLNLVQDLALGTQVQLLGLGGQNIKVLINGVPVIGRLDGDIDLDQLSLVGIERIEVVEGPMGVEYGTDALAGTINIITKSPQQVLSGEVRGQANTVGRSEVSVDASVPFNGWNGRIAARRNYFDGLESDVERVYFWKPKEQRNLRAELNRPLEQGMLGVDVELFQERLWSDGAVQYQQIEVPVNDSIVGIYSTPYAFDQTFDTERYSGRAYYRDKLGAWNVDGFVAGNLYIRERINRRKDLNTLEQQVTAGVEDHDTTSFVNWSSRATFSRGQQHTWTLGYDVNHETAAGKRFETGQDAYINAALFGIAEFHWGGFTARPGVRVQYHSVYQAPLVPSINLRYQKQDWVFRASYGRGFRAPSLKELHFFFVDSNHNIRGNQDLLAETSHAAQVSAVYKQVKDNWHWNAEIQGFYNDVEDLIALALVDNDTQLYSYVNVSDQTNYGTQTRMSIGWKRLSADLSGSLLWRSSIIDPNDRGLDQPAWQAAGGLRYTIFKWNTVAAVRYRHNGVARSYVLIEEELVENEIEAYGLLSASLSKSFLGDRLQIQIGANNLLDVVNVNRSIPTSGGVHAGPSGSLPIGTGRTAYVQLAWKFQHVR